ncbi:MAG: hypothetical protein KY452_08725 [Actinobacteria bacterium]|nr:hypothetical protein [Actinomycetota bacterium]
MGTDERGPGAGESSADETPSGVTRREAIKKGAIVGGTVMWVAPLVQTVGMSSASAQTASPQPGDCVCTRAESFDVTATFTGLVSGSVGPVMNFPDEGADGEDCLAELPLSVTAPNTLTAFLTANADCVGGTTSGGTCSAFVQLADLAVDLTAINAALDVKLNADVVRAEASCTCAGCTASACITQTQGEAILTIGGTVVLAGAVAEICGPLEFNINIDAGALGTVSGTVVLNDTSENPCQATVATINATVTDLLGDVTQTVNIVIAQATVECTQA